jgi:hypothetical protein
MIRPTIRFNSLHIEDVHPRVSIWDVNADKLKSIELQTMEGLNPTRVSPPAFVSLRSGGLPSLQTSYLGQHEAQRFNTPRRRRQPNGLSPARWNTR